MTPVVPTLINVCAPIRINSSTAIAAAGPPIPVLVADIGTPLYLPVYVTYSLCLAISFFSSQYLTILYTLPGSPGRRT